MIRSLHTPKSEHPTPTPVDVLRPRLVDLDGAARYLGGLSPWTVRDLIANGTLARVRVPLPGGGELRRVLLDVQDLDRLIGRCKDPEGSA